MGSSKELKDEQIKKMLEMYSVRDIISIFSGIDQKIRSLHEASSQDFMILNNLLKKYYTQAKPISEGANTIFDILSGQGDDPIYGELKNLYGKLNKQSNRLHNKFEISARLLERENTILNLIFVPLNNFKQNLMTLKFLVANFKLNMVYHDVALQAEVEVELNKIDVLIGQIKLIYPNLNNGLLLLKKQIKNMQMAQREIEKGMANSISAILNKVFTSINMLTEQHEAAGQYLPKLKQRGENYTKSIGQIVTNLQYHDIIRQKMEHIQDTHKEIVLELNQLEKSNNMPELFARQARYITEIPDIAEIQVAQLILTNKEYQSAIDLITRKMIEIDDDLNSISGMCLSISGLSNDAEGPQLEKVKANLNNAILLTRGFSKATESFNEQLDSLVTMIGKLQPDFETIKKLNIELKDIVNRRFNKSEIGKLDKEFKILNQQFNGLAEDIDQTTSQLVQLYNEAKDISGSLIQNVDKDQLQLSENLQKDIEQIIATLQFNLNMVQQTSIENAELSSSISSDIKASIQNVKYYDFFEKVIEEIVIELNNIFTKLKSNEGVGVKEKLSNLKAIEEFYTMHSERMIHANIANNQDANTEQIVDMQKQNEDEIELF